jgi:hypothetical protein
MRRMSVYLRNAVLLVLTALTLSSTLIVAEEESLVLDMSVQTKLSSLMKDYKPDKALTRTTERREINNRGNFGKLVYEQRRAIYKRQGSGLWAVVSTAALGTSSGSAESLSLCGLVTLLSATVSTTSFDQMISIPSERLFGYFSIRHSIDWGRRLRVMSFETSANNICAPAPGAEFSYRVETEMEIKTSGLLGVTRVATGVDDFSCKVSAESRPAKEIFPSLRGDALFTSCERIAKSGAKAKLEFAFLRDAGVYLLLTEDANVQTTKVHYEEVQQRE